MQPGPFSVTSLSVQLFINSAVVPLTTSNLKTFLGNKLPPCNNYNLSETGRGYFNMSKITRRAGGSYSRAVHSAGAAGAAGGQSFARKTKFLFFFFSITVFDFAGLFLVAILVRNLYTGDLCEGVRNLLMQTNNPRYGPNSLVLKSLTEAS